MPNPINPNLKDIAAALGQSLGPPALGYGLDAGSLIRQAGQAAVQQNPALKLPTPVQPIAPVVSTPWAPVANPMSKEEAEAISRQTPIVPREMFYHFLNVQPPK